MPIHTQKEAWDSGRPVYDRLPVYGYKNNEEDLGSALTDWVDHELTRTKEVAETFYQTFDPDLCPVDRLDYLAWFHELTGSFWDVKWSEPVKRQIIKLARSYLWLNRGSVAVIRKLLDVHQIQHGFWLPRPLVLPYRLDANALMGGPAFRWFLRLPLRYRRTSREWKEAVRTVTNFAPIITQHKVCYDGFYVGFSVVGDPLFRRPLTPVPDLTHWHSFTRQGPMSSAAVAQPEFMPAGSTHVFSTAWTVNSTGLNISTAADYGFTNAGADIEVKLDIDLPIAPVIAFMFRRGFGPTRDIRYQVNTTNGSNVIIDNVGTVTTVATATTPVSSGRRQILMRVRGTKFQVIVDGVTHFEVNDARLEYTGATNFTIAGATGITIRDIQIRPLTSDPF